MKSLILKLGFCTGVEDKLWHDLRLPGVCSAARPSWDMFSPSMDIWVELVDGIKKAAVKETKE